MQGVYKILNTLDGKFYIGSSVDIEKRFKAHKKALNDNKHNNKYLQNAWNKYGADNFEFLVVEEVTDKSILRSRESYYLKTTHCTNHNIGYNLLNDTNIGLGVQASDEIKSKISQACTGSKNGNFGRKHSAEEIALIRERRWGSNYQKKPRKSYKRKSEEEKLKSRQRQSEYMRNRIITDKTREKMRNARLGVKASSELRKRFSESRKGEKNANCKLTKQQALEVYEKMNSGVNYKLVCQEYGIKQSLAYKIKRKEHWAFNDEQ